jgi:hypothetical protein
VRRLDLSIRAPTAATVNQSSTASFDLKFSVVNARETHSGIIVLVIRLKSSILQLFEYMLWLVDRAVIGSIPQDIVEIGSGSRDVA